MQAIKYIKFDVIQMSILFGGVVKGMELIYTKKTDVKRE